MERSSQLNEITIREKLGILTFRASTTHPISLIGQERSKTEYSFPRFESINKTWDPSFNRTNAIWPSKAVLPRQTYASFPRWRSMQQRRTACSSSSPAMISRNSCVCMFYHQSTEEIKYFTALISTWMQKKFSSFVLHKRREKVHTLLLHHTSARSWNPI